MRYVLILCGLLVGCSDNPKSDSADHGSQRASTAIPADTEDAVAILLAARPYTDPAAAARAAGKLHAFEESVVLSELTLENKETGAHFKQVTHRFRKLGVDVTYVDGQVIGAARVTDKPQ